MTWRTVTAVVIVAAPIVIGAYDLVAFSQAGNRATISRLCLDTAGRYPGFLVVLAFGFGVLCGHLFVPQHVPSGP